MKHIHPTLEGLVVWVAAAALLGLGLCCLEPPAGASGWTAPCHGAEGMGGSASEAQTGCGMARLAVATEGAEAGSTVAPGPTTPLVTTLTTAPSDGLGAATNAPMGAAVRAAPPRPLPPRFLLHSSFLL